MITTSTSELKAAQDRLLAAATAAKGKLEKSATVSANDLVLVVEAAKSGTSEIKFGEQQIRTGLVRLK